jgi:hypothetical protein
MPIWIYLLIAALLILIAWIAFGYFGSRAEQLPYRVVSTKRGYEIREIPEHLVAETEVKGGWDTGGREAFLILADYIFGNNKAKTKIAMTTPVTQTTSEKIAMTAPVISGEGAAGKSIFSFVLPAKYTMATLPAPVDKRVTIKTVKKRQMAVLRFSGFFSKNIFEQKKKQLLAMLDRDGIKHGKIYSAGYNPPWTPPFMNRLEIWAEIS